MLNLTKALQLAKLLLPYIPYDASEITVLVFSDKIVSGMLEAGNSRDYFKIVSLVSGIDPDELLTMTVPTVFQLFIAGLQENEILSLIEFYKGL